MLTLSPVTTYNINKHFLQIPYMIKIKTLFKFEINEYQMTECVVHFNITKNASKLSMTNNHIVYNQKMFKVVIDKK